MIKTSVLTALLEIYPAIKEQYGYDPEDAVKYTPDITSIDDFKKVIGITTIHFLPVSREGIAYTGYSFSCNWDEEHGLGIITHKERIIEIGGADTAFLEWVAEKDLE